MNSFAYPIFIRARYSHGYGSSTLAEFRVARNMDNSVTYKIMYYNVEGENASPKSYYDSSYVYVSAALFFGTYIESTTAGEWISELPSGVTEIVFTPTIPSFYKNYANESSLAAALGGLGVDEQALSTSADDIRTGRYFARNKNPSDYNIPAYYGALFSECVTQGSFSNVYQVFMTIDRDYFVRFGNGAADSSLTWTSWKAVTMDLPSFYKNYNDLSSLSSALGVTFNEQPTNLDASSYSSLEDVPQGMYWWQESGVPSFSPSGYDYAILIVLSSPPSISNISARVAFCFNIPTQKISCNYYYSGVQSYRGWFQVN